MARSIDSPEVASESNSIACQMVDGSLGDLECKVDEKKWRIPKHGLPAAALGGSIVGGNSESRTQGAITTAALTAAIGADADGYENWTQGLKDNWDQHQSTDPSMYSVRHNVPQTLMQGAKIGFIPGVILGTNTENIWVGAGTTAGVAGLTTAIGEDMKSNPLNGGAAVERGAPCLEGVASLVDAMPRGGINAFEACGATDMDAKVGGIAVGGGGLIMLGYHLFKLTHKGFKHVTRSKEQKRDDHIEQVSKLSRKKAKRLEAAVGKSTLGEMSTEMSETGFGEKISLASMLGLSGLNDILKNDPDLKGIPVTSTSFDKTTKMLSEKSKRRWLGLREGERTIAISGIKATFLEEFNAFIKGAGDNGANDKSVLHKYVDDVSKSAGISVSLIGALNQFQDPKNNRNMKLKLADGETVNLDVPAKGLRKRAVRGKKKHSTPESLYSDYAASVDINKTTQVASLKSGGKSFKIEDTEYTIGYAEGAWWLREDGKTRDETRKISEISVGGGSDADGVA